MESVQDHFCCPSGAALKSQATYITTLICFLEVGRLKVLELERIYQNRTGCNRFPGQPEVATDLPLIYYLIYTPLLRSAEECTTSYTPFPGLFPLHTLFNTYRSTINCGQKSVTEWKKV